MTAPRRSRKTTTLGLIGAVGVLMVAISRLFDGDPSTSVDVAGALDALGAILAFAGIAGAGLFARDDDVTSEDSGAAGKRDVREIASGAIADHLANPTLSLLRAELKRQGFDADKLTADANGGAASKPPAPEVGP